MFSVAVGLASSSLGQEVQSPTPSLSSGFSPRSTDAAVVSSESLLKNLQLSFGLSASYDSNLFQGSGAPGDPEVGDYVLTPTANLEYLTRNRRFQLGASVDLSREFNIKEDNLGTFNAGAEIFGGLKSRKVILNARLGLRAQEGVNRFTDAILEQRTSSIGVDGRYNLSPKTGIFGSIVYSDTQSDGGNSADRDSLDLETSVLWRATPLLSVGLGVVYSQRDQEEGDSFEAIGPSLRFNYDLSSKVKLRSSFGIDFAEVGSEGSDTLTSWSLGLGYRANAFWGLDLSLLQDTRASVTRGGGFEELTTTQISYTRRIRDFSTRLSLGYEVRDQVIEEAGSLAIPDSDFFFASLSVSTPILKKKANLTWSISYSDYDSDSELETWDSIRTGLNLTYEF